MDSLIINTISLCTGVGMLDEAFRLGCEHLGLRTKPALYCEWDSYAAACLLARMEEQSLEPGPIWCGDCGEIDFRAFRKGLVAFLAGFPCQPFSVAGQQLGHEDERNIWPDIVRAIRQSQPDIILLENVPGLASTPTIHHRPDLLAHFAALDAAIKSARCSRDRWYSGRHRERLYRRLLREQGVSALLYVKSSLEALDYIVEEPLFVTAESVGASHRRERVFILAIRKGGTFRELWKSSRRNGVAVGGNEELLKWPDGAEHSRSGGDVADAGGTNAERRRVARSVAGASGTIESQGHQRERGGDAAVGQVADVADAQQQSGSTERRTRSRRRTNTGPNDQPVLGGASDVGNSRSERRQTRDLAVQRSGDQPSAGPADDVGEGCCDVGDTRSIGASKSWQPSERQPEQQPGRSGEPSGRCGSMGNATGIDGGERIGQRIGEATGTGPESRFEGSDEAVGDATEQHGTDSADRPTFEPGRRSEALGVGLADSHIAGSQERGSERSNAKSQLTAAERSGAAIFAPGPGADWASIPEHLWPAVEPGVRVLVDGVELVLDESRADQLRCAGNGVVALAAAVAVVELMRRIK